MMFEASLQALELDGYANLMPKGLSLIPSAMHHFCEYSIMIWL